MNFRFCVLKDDLACRVRDSDIECVYPWGVKKIRGQNNLTHGPYVYEMG